MSAMQPRLALAALALASALACSPPPTETAPPPPGTIAPWPVPSNEGELIRAAGQPFIIVPLSALATGSQPPSEQADASAIFNVMRNLGGSIGIAALDTFITFREQYISRSSATG